MNSIPKGYKKTEVGVIPDEWNVLDIDHITDKVGSGITPSGGSLVYSTNGHPFIRSQNVGWGNFIMDDIVYINDHIHKKQLSTEVKWGDILLNITGASIGRSSVVLRDDLIGGNVNQHVCIIRLCDQYDSKFVNINILSNLVQNQIKAFQAGGNREGLNFSQVRVIKMPFPPSSERQAITEVLSDMDALIEAQKELIAKKRNIKQGTMQDLLSGRVRLPGYETKGWKHTDIGDIPDDWEINRLGLISQTITKGTTPKTMGFDFKGTGINFIKIEAISENGRLILSELSYIDEKCHNAFKRSQLESGDILFSIAGALGRRLLVKSCILPSNINQALAIIRLKNIDKNYIYHYLESSSVKSYIKNSYSQGAQSNLSLRDVKYMNILLPSPGEQQVIAKVLSDMDDELETLEAELEKLNHMKRGMMQELLTGRIRLI